MNESFKTGFEKTAKMGNYIGKALSWADDIAKKRAVGAAQRAADRAKYMAQFGATKSQAAAIRTVPKSRPLIKEELKKEMPELSKYTQNRTKGMNEERLYRAQGIGSNLTPKRKNY